MPSDQAYSRRRLLQAVLLGVAGGTAGCNDRSTPATTSTAPPPTGTPVDDQAPSIRSYEASPKKNGTVLAVSMEGEDNRGLETARIAYGERELHREPDGTTVALEGTLQDTASTSPEDGRVAFVLTDAGGNETRKHVQPDEDAPELAVETRPTPTAGEAVLTITAEDDTGLAEVHALLNGQTLQSHDTAGSTEYSDERTITVPQKQRFQRTPVGARAQDWNGNTSEKDVQTYVRKYDSDLDDTRLDIGAIWTSQQGGAFKQGCRENYEGIEPAVGIYDEDPIPTEVVSQHIDQMTGHGISRLVYDYEGIYFDVKRGRVEELLDSPLIDQIEIEPFYTKKGLLWRPEEDWKETVLPEDLTYLRDNVLNRDNAATIDGRPVVSTWNFTYFLYNDDARDKLLDDFGSFETFVDDMRHHLRVDGADPFLIVGKGASPVFEGYEIGEFVQHFDGMTTWMPGDAWHEEPPTPWEDALKSIRDTFRNNSRFAQEHGMEFIPRAFPGYNELGTGCGRAGYKQIPRSTDRFRQVLEIAEDHATTERIDIATWNDWAEGSQIEPGTFNGEEYGTDYLEVIKEFQRGGTG